MDAKPLLDWQGVVFQYVGFLSSFGMLGAIGFRYLVLRGDDVSQTAESELADPFRNAAASAAGVGFVGAALGGVSLLEGLVTRAEAKHQSIVDALDAGGATSLAQVILLGVLLVAFALAWRRLAFAWPIAAAAGLAFALRNLLGGRLAAMVNPLHVLGGSLWLGTLFVLVVCGISQVMHGAVPVAKRETAIARMVHRFSIVGLSGAGLLGITGVVTSWTHLNPLSALWTTPYGYALLAKLTIVAVVVGLGAWNWRRVGPALGSDGGGATVRRTASVELAFAALVLLLTAILVSLPSPKPPARASADPNISHAS